MGNDSTVNRLAHKIFLVQSQAGKWGYLEEDLELAMKGDLSMVFIYDDADLFSENLAAVKIDGKWGYINPFQNLVIKLYTQKLTILIMV